MILRYQKNFLVCSIHRNDNKLKIENYRSPVKTFPNSIVLGDIRILELKTKYRPNNMILAMEDQSLRIYLKTCLCQNF